MIDNRYRTNTSCLLLFQFFLFIFSVCNSFVILPTGQSIQIEHIGSVQVTKSLLLTNVLYVPSFTFNLLSISSLTTTHSYIVNFLSNSCEIQDLFIGQLIGTSKRHNNLYILNQPTSNFAKISCVKSSNHFSSLPYICNQVSSQLWHSRLGHPFFVKLQVLKSTLNISEINKCDHCSICNLEKQRKLPFPSSITTSHSTFDLIHCEIWGPFHIMTPQGHRYF